MKAVILAGGLGTPISEESMKHEYSNYRCQKGWDTLFEPTQQERQLFDYEFRSVPIGCGVEVVDVGFGNGALLQWAAERGASVAGIEIQQDLLVEASAKGIRTYRNLKEISDSTVNLITFMDVFEHLEWSEIADCLLDIKRVLVNDGYLIARFPNCQSPAGLIDQFGDRTHKTMLSGPIFTGFLDAYGFKVLEVREAKGAGDFGVGLLDGITVRIKGMIRVLVKRAYRVVFGTGNTLLSPSVIIVAVAKTEK